MPYTFDLLDRVRFEEMHLPALRLVLQAGGRLEPERVRAYAELGRTRGWDFAVMYGQTEATARMAVLPPALAAQWPNSIGRPIPGGDFRIEPVPGAAEGIGELVYRGPNVMLGYADSPSDLALGRVVHELRTGDLGRELPDGLFEVTGRRSAFIKVAGHRIDLDHVERRIQASGGPAWLAGRDDMLVAAVEGDQDAPDVARLASELAAIPGHLVHVLPVAEVPRLPTGKPDRAAILSLAATELDATQANEAPTADVSDPVSAITALYTEATGRQAADGDSFVGLEGDSLSYVHASLGLEEIVGRPPADWPTMTIGQLAALATPRDRRPRWRRALAVRWIDASVLLRAVAILCIVAQHTGALQILGGAHVLLAVAGFNFARFQLTPASRPQRLRSQARAIARIAVPAVVWIGLMLVLVDDYQLQNLFLANAIVGPERFDSTWHFWFVEMLLYVLVAMALLVSIPAVDRFERRWPLALAASVLLTGLLFRFGILEHDLTNPRPVLWLFAIGWAAGKTTTNWQRLALAGIAILAVPGFYGDTQRELIIGGGVLILIAVRHVPMPRLVAPVAGVLASASLYIYLVHWQVWKSLPDAPRLPVFALCIAAGLVAWLVAGRLTAWAVRGRGALLRRRSDGQAQVLPASAG